ncbi:enteropeptidase [Pholidichthys leucotaenia]
MTETTKKRRVKRFSSLEVVLIIISSLLLLCCIGLIVVTWLSLMSEGGVDPDQLTGRMVITEGAEFSEELKNSSSGTFKGLAYDVEQMSVVVTFDLWFSQVVDVKEAAQQLGAGLQEVDSRGLIIDRNSLVITEKPHQTTPGPAPGSTSLGPTTSGATTSGPTTSGPTTSGPTTSGQTPGPTTPVPSPSGPTAVICPPLLISCLDQISCIPIDRLCDGVDDCPDSSDEAADFCATTCDGQFILSGPSGSFSSSKWDQYNSSSFCRWIIRVDDGLSVQVSFPHFETEIDLDTVRLYEGVGVNRILTGEFSGSTPPGTVWLLTNQSTVEFTSDEFNNLSGFKATYTAVDTSNLSDEQKLTCTFEQDMCLWRQLQDDNGDWMRISGPTFPPATGPSVDHTLGNSSGFYIVTPVSPGQWKKSFRIQSLPLTPPTQPMCLSFWYHMFGEDVRQLSVLLLSQDDLTVVFQKDGNYGDTWNYGQVTLNLTSETTVLFEAVKEGGRFNDIALDDIMLASDTCGPAPPEPTNVPAPTTPPPMPVDCGGPFDLWEPNSTFSSPNYPQSYGNNAECVWTLHAEEDHNIQLHFLDFDVEATYDVVEVRDGAGTNSTILAVLSGSGPTHDLFSTTNQMTLWFYTDKSGNGRGFRANFTSGVGLGLPAPCAAGQFQCGTGSCIHGNTKCDGQVNCPDGTDEAECVWLQVNGSTRLHFQVSSLLLTVCADTWSSHLINFTCQYLGYRSGEASLLPAQPEDSQFVMVTVTNNGTLETSISENCSSEQVVSLQCDNQREQIVSSTGPVYPGSTDVGAAEEYSMDCERNAESGYSTDSKDDMERKQRPDSPPFFPQPELKQEERKPGSIKTPTDEFADVVRVVSGTNAAEGAWPWMVSLHWRGRHVCGASLIGHDWLLTAAHCVYGKNVAIQHWTAVLGLHAQTNQNAEEVQTQQVDRIVIHHQYDRRTKQADIAMMHLNQPISFSQRVQPVCLPAEGQSIATGTKCFISGWGEDENGYLPDILQEAQVPLVDQHQCQFQLPEYTITSSMLCAGYPEGGVDSCQGDSGGPLMCLDDGYWTLIGVTSFGIGCGLPQKPGVYARVSAFHSWIADTRRSAYS